MSTTPAGMWSCVRSPDRLRRDVRGWAPRRDRGAHPALLRHARSAGSGTCSGKAADRHSEPVAGVSECDLAVSEDHGGAAEHTTSAPTSWWKDPPSCTCHLPNPVPMLRVPTAERGDQMEYILHHDVKPTRSAERARPRQAGALPGRGRGEQPPGHVTTSRSFVPASEPWQRYDVGPRSE